jgi:hypothetical protein
MKKITPIKVVKVWLEAEKTLLDSSPKGFLQYEYYKGKIDAYESVKKLLETYYKQSAGRGEGA